MILSPVSGGQAGALAACHALSFETAAWSARDIAALLAAPGGYAIAAHQADATAGFILARAIAGEGEILTLAVAPAHRRRGVASALVEAAAAGAMTAGAAALFLEVAADNIAAIALYTHAGFGQVGLRRGYYAHDGAAPVDALVLRRTLNRPAG